MKFRFIARTKQHFPVHTLCRMLGVSESGFYAWKGRTPNAHSRMDDKLLVHIRSAFACSNETYGSPRMVHELRDQGFDVGRRRVARLMRDHGLKARQKRRFKRTTDSNHDYPVAPNLLDGNFIATKPNQKWASDISYIWTRQGWLYLAIVMDLYSRRIVGWAVSDRLKKELVLKALGQAVALRDPPDGLIHHSDRGSQYCSHAYRKALSAIKAKVSMSGKGNCYDNAVVETFFKTIKSEMIWRMSFQTRAQARKEIARYIDAFYNPVRRHSTCGYTSPMKFEMMTER